MNKRSMACAIFVFLPASYALAQSAPQRSEELCAALKQSSVEKGLEFTVTRPGACWAGIDKGYHLTVDYDQSMLALGLMVDIGVGNDEAFWLRLSALDNLSHVALGTRQQVVFDELNKLSKRVAKEMLPLLKQGNTNAEIIRFGKAQRARLLVTGRYNNNYFQVSAVPADIEKMKRKQKQEASGEVSTWRRVLATALLAFAAGAKGYEQGYRSYQQSRPKQQQQFTVCYTNFLGYTAITHCY